MEPHKFNLMGTSLSMLPSLSPSTIRKRRKKSGKKEIGGYKKESREELGL